jgi:serine/threonine protein kinase
VNADRLIGTDVAGYSIEAVLGRGGMGIVYLARQRSPDRKLALKLITPTFADDEGFRRRFLRESVAAAAIDHPHILPVYDAGESDGVLFIAMRLVDGEDLKEILRASGPLDLERVLTIAGQVGSALDAAHARGLVHRDVKPGNILVAREAGADDAVFCYLTDFGVSTWTTTSAGTMTSTGQLVGSVNYIAPEQIEGTRIDARADVYSLGCVLYECLTGRALFAGRSPPGVLHAHIHEDPSPPSSLRPNLPPAVDEVLARSLKKAPSDRYASCRELTLDLRSALAGDALHSGRAAEPVQTIKGDPADLPTLGRTNPASPPSRPGARSFWIIAAAVVAALVVTLASLALADRSGRVGSSATGTSPSAAGAPRLIREGVQVTASRVAPSRTDAAGHLVNYLPSNVVDGNVETAWRTGGNGHGATLRLLFDGPVDIVRIGLIPGYAKSDPETGVNRFEQDRVISKVRYLIPGLAPTTKEFRPEPFPQYVNVSATASRVTVRILATTKPGGVGGDYTAISEIYVYGYPQ